MARRRKTQTVEPPETIEAAQAMLARIGAVDAQIDLLCAREEREITALKTETARRVDPLEDEADGLVRALQAYVETNAGDLFAKNRDSVEWPSGKVGLRHTTPAVSIAKGKAAAVLETLRQSHPEFVRTTHAIDKPALIAARARLPDIDGLSVGRRREFFAKPTDSARERNRKIPKAKVRKS